MHIPAVDSLRQERVGLVQNDGSEMLLKTHVKTDDTDELGAHDPIEGMARPFPLLLKAMEATVVETSVENSTLTPLSETLIEYISFLHKSMEEGEWREELEDYETDDFPNESEAQIAGLLFQFASRDIPLELSRSVYREADKEINRETDSALNPPTFTDIEDHKQYDFNYIPHMDEVDEWELKLSNTDTELDDGQHVYSEIVWLRYRIGETMEERPILSYQNETSEFVVLSQSVDFGETEMESVPDALLQSLFSEPTDEWELSAITVDQLEGTRTKEYLEASLEE